MLTVPPLPVNVPRSETTNVSYRLIAPPVWSIVPLLSQLPYRLNPPPATLMVSLFCRFFVLSVPDGNVDRAVVVTVEPVTTNVLYAMRNSARAPFLRLSAAGSRHLV